MAAKLALILELAGLSAVIAGCFVVATWLGLVVGGLLLVVVGAAVEKAG